MYVSFYTNSLLQGWQMTRILTIVAILFATPALSHGGRTNADGCQQEGDGYFWPAKPPHKPLKH
jgi:hypothetical protein